MQISDEWRRACDFGADLCSIDAESTLVAIDGGFTKNDYLQNIRYFINYMA